MRISRITAPLPGLALSTVNLYLINGKVLVDAGQYSIQTLHVLIRSLNKHGTKLSDIEMLVLTHFHADHATLTPVLKDLNGNMIIYMGEHDLDLIKRGAEKFVNDVLEIYTRNGVPMEEIKSITENHPVMRLAEIYRKDLAELDIKPLRNGDAIRFGSDILEVINCAGHTPGSICLYNNETKEIIVGDAILQNITPSVIYHKYSSDPLEDHLNTMRRVISLDPVIAYPGHRDEIRYPRRRAEEIIDFHMRRLDEITSYLRDKDQTAYELAKKIRWRVKYETWDQFPFVERFFAIGETLAHLKYLERRRIVESYEKNNVIYWTMAK